MCVQRSQSLKNSCRSCLFYLLLLAHTLFESIHPFHDGNGRVGRILLNYLVVSNGYPPIVIKGMSSEDRQRYYAALEAGDKGFLSLRAQGAVRRALSGPRRARRLRAMDRRRASVERRPARALVGPVDWRSAHAASIPVQHLSRRAWLGVRREDVGQRHQRHHQRHHDAGDHLLPEGEKMS